MWAEELRYVSHHTRTPSREENVALHLIEPLVTQWLPVKAVYQVQADVNGGDF